MTSNEKKQGEKGNIVLGVYIHCPGCAKSVIKCLKGYDGVESVQVDSDKNKVTVRGEKANPTKIADRAKIVEVVLKIYLHCEGCAKSVKRCIHKMPGVQTVETDMEKNLVRVKGAIEAEKLVEFVIKREGKHAVIVKPEKKNQNEEEEQKEKEVKKKNWYDDLTPELVYAPQLFSDENPNSCSVM